MQTFLPYPDFAACAACLDDRRLGKQRVEAYQLLRVLRGETRGWRNHPAARMWRGYEPALGAYMNAMIDEWIRRGHRNTMQRVPVEAYDPPWWLGRGEFHASHRANLLRKDREHYGRHGWTEDPSTPYVWPQGAAEADGSSRPATGRPRS